MENNPFLQSFADSEHMMAAVKEVLLKTFSTDNLAATESDMVLGQMVRARLVGIEKVEKAWREIAAYKSTEKPVDTVNPGR